MDHVFKYFLHVTLNFSSSFLRIVRISGKLLKILMPAFNVLFWKHERLDLVYENGAYSLY